MNEAEKRTDEILEMLGKELHRQRIETFDKIDEMQTGGKQAPLKKRRRRNRWIPAAAVFFICIITVGVMTVSSDAFRGKLFGFVFIEHDEYSDLVKQDADVSGEFTVRYPSYIPEGYEKTEEEAYDGICIITYENTEAEDIISISQMSEDGLSVSIDNETSTREKCFVNINEAYYIGGNENHMLIWDENGIFYEITSTLDKDALIKIAEHLE